MRGVYNVQNIDFNLSQFALFLDNDTIYITVHINDTIKTLGRKPMTGDVIELPHLRDEFAFNDLDFSLPRFYVVDDVGRASEGFSMTWYPHLYRLKLTKLKAQQQFSDILNVPADKNINYLGDYSSSDVYQPGDVIRYNGVLYSVTATTSGQLPPDAGFFIPFNGLTLENVLSTKAKSLEINDAVLAQAEADAPLSGYDTRHFYTLAVDDYGNTNISEVPGNPDLHQSLPPVRPGYTGYLLGDGIPPNGASFGSGGNFPSVPMSGDYFLRTDFLPNRLFRFNGSSWVKVEDAVRHPLTNSDSRMTQKLSFINNATVNTIGTEQVPERQSLSKALRPKADF